MSYGDKKPVDAGRHIGGTAVLVRYGIRTLPVGGLRPDSLLHNRMGAILRELVVSKESPRI